MLMKRRQDVRFEASSLVNRFQGFGEYYRAHCLLSKDTGISLSIMPSGSVHVVANGKTVLFYCSVIFHWVFIYIHHLFFICSCVRVSLMCGIYKQNNGNKQNKNRLIETETKGTVPRRQGVRR